MYSGIEFFPIFQAKAAQGTERYPVAAAAVQIHKPRSMKNPQMISVFHQIFPITDLCFLIPAQNHNRCMPNEQRAVWNWIFFLNVGSPPHFIMGVLSRKSVDKVILLPIYFQMEMGLPGSEKGQDFLPFL